MSELELELPKGWINVRLEDLVYIAGRIGWRGLKAEEYTERGPLFLSVYNLNKGDEVDFQKVDHISNERYEESPEIQLEENDILLAKDGSIGKVGIIKNLPGPATVNSSLLVIRSGKAFIPKFLLCFLKGPKLQKIVRERTKGSGIPHLFQKDIKKFILPLAPLEEQKRIVSKIEELFSKIDPAKQSLEQTKLQLEQYRHSLPKFLFEGGHNEKWEKTKLGQVSKLYVPMRDKPKKFDGDIPWLRIEDLDGKYAFDSKSNQRISQKTVDEMKLRIYPIGTVLCSCSATLGVCAITKKSLCTNQTFIGIFPNSTLNNEFLYYYMLTQINNLTKAGHGGTIKYISRKKFEELPIKIPPLEEQEQVVTQIEQGFSLIENTSQIVNSTLQQLETMKMSILKQAFQGKIVPQDPNDEPASVLLERIQKEKIRN